MLERGVNPCDELCIGYIGIMEKKMETTLQHRGSISSVCREDEEIKATLLYGVIYGVYRGNGTENGSYLFQVYLKNSLLNSHLSASNLGQHMSPQPSCHEGPVSSGLCLCRLPSLLS